MDDFDRLAHDIICVVRYGTRNGTCSDEQMRRVSAMLRSGPGITTWPRDLAEANQRARDAAMRKPMVVKLAPVLKPIPLLKVPS